ncbi:probable palmitoyltransferase ZDHHC24 [Drosophila takahashii]|uniref:probable palmitoyltransferase ZDHHC24 n=1 Tax=Drosophila takahashii TaxID=29030 RepID=UPI001CF81150|nr:probable palmitoyltransferase ZDHHC24 [Drosophila takahashii]
MCIVVTYCEYYAHRFPKKFVQIVHPLSTIFVVGTIVFFFWMQMFLIAPQVYNDFGYKLLWIVVIFIMHNILGNWIACYRTNSSVEILPKESQVPVPEKEHLWRFCDTCNKLMPPRSWHCALCNCCILRRDHHCIFMATCIGLNNQRYFIWFAFYSTFALILSFATFVIYFARVGCSTLLSPDIFVILLLNCICGVQRDRSKESLFQTTVFLFNIVVLLIPGSMLAYQIQILWRNSCYYKINDSAYDLGFLKNCKLILGQRGLWTFLSPFLKSPLPHDGTKWEMMPQSN